MSTDIIRVLRTIEYVGPRDRVEDTVARSIHGTKPAGHGMYIHAATVGAFSQEANESETWFVNIYNAALEARDVLRRLADHEGLYGVFNECSVYEHCCKALEACEKATSTAHNTSREEPLS